VTDERSLIDEQIAYYRARATEYDATSIPDDDPLEDHTERIREALRALSPGGRVIEIAAGTGQWTATLAEHADELLVTDTSPEMLELNRARVGERPNVRYEVADAFGLPASHAHDLAFFGFFLSHVPSGSFEAFWGVVDGLLAFDGRVVFVDEGVHDRWREDWVDEAAGIVRRPLLDGSVHLAIKVLWRPADLASRLRELGWDASVSAEGPFYWGSAVRR
jgi:demethylmenaquinone methyltransferase/2-methoxy-6-polyprenyl-1,4-benzoquinol methylase